MEKGMERWKYFISKMVIGWLAAVIFLFCAFAMGFLCYKMFFDTGIAPDMNVKNMLKGTSESVAFTDVLAYFQNK